MAKKTLEELFAELMMARFCAGGCGTTVDGPYLCDPCMEKADRKRDNLGRYAWESIPRRYHWASVTSELLQTRVAGGLESIQTACRALDDRKSILIIGNSGRGKTSLAVALLRRVIEQGRAEGATEAQRIRTHKARFFYACDIAKAQHYFPLGKGLAPEVEASTKASVLVLDELGAEQYNTAPICDLIHERNSEELQTIATTWLRGKEVKDRYGDGILRRLGEFVVIDLQKANP